MICLLEPVLLVKRAQFTDCRGLSSYDSWHPQVVLPSRWRRHRIRRRRPLPGWLRGNQQLPDSGVTGAGGHPGSGPGIPARTERNGAGIWHPIDLVKGVAPGRVALICRPGSAGRSAWQLMSAPDRFWQAVALPVGPCRAVPLDTQKWTPPKGGQCSTPRALLWRLGRRQHGADAGEGSAHRSACSGWGCQ